mgnify:CR=1 FL=1
MTTSPLRLWPLLLASVLIGGCTSDTPEDTGTTKERPHPTDPTTDTGTGEETVLPTLEFPEANVVINELMARNDSTWVAPEGDRPDWVELVNLGDEDIPLHRLSITDINGNEWDKASGTIKAGERLLLSSTDLGLNLSSDEDVITLYVDNDTVLDEVSWVGLERDVAIARLPDLTGPFTRTVFATPGSANGTVPSESLDAATETIFLRDQVHRIDFTLTEQAIGQINTRSENWGQAAMTFDDQHYDAVGLRLKGSASFDLMDGKPAFKVDMNKGVPGTRLRTLKGFNLHNGNVYDPTRARDHISYRLAREAGLMAPRVGWTDVYVNGTYFGIYMIIEQHDDQMIEVNFPGLGETGYMFEPNEASGGGFSWGDFGGGGIGGWDLEEGAEPPAPEIITALQSADELVAGNASDAAIEELWNHVDKESLLSYMAWEAVISHTDGYKAPNNWRVFVHPVDAKVHLVPAGAEWTWDNSPSPLSWGGNLAQFCLDNRGCRRDYGARALEVAAMVDDIDLRTDFEEVSDMLAPYLAADPRSSHNSSTVASQRQSTIENIDDYPNEVASDICDDMPALEGCTPQ